MPMDLKDWRKQQEEKRAFVRSAPNVSGLERLRQAAVPAEKLMADEHWRLYQQMLQGAIEAQVKNRDRLLLQLMSDVCNSYEDMTRVKRLIAECEAMIRAWQTAIDLPKQLLESAERAAAALAAATERFDEPKEIADGVH